MSIVEVGYTQGTDQICKCLRIVGFWEKGITNMKAEEIRMSSVLLDSTQR